MENRGSFKTEQKGRPFPVVPEPGSGFKPEWGETGWERVAEREFESSHGRKPWGRRLSHFTDVLLSFHSGCRVIEALVLASGLDGLIRYFLFKRLSLFFVCGIMLTIWNTLTLDKIHSGPNVLGGLIGGRPGMSAVHSSAHSPSTDEMTLFVSISGQSGLWPWGLWGGFSQQCLHLLAVELGMGKLPHLSKPNPSCANGVVRRILWQLCKLLCKMTIAIQMVVLLF